jgi:hypothetical protein
MMRDPATQRGLSLSRSRNPSARTFGTKVPAYSPVSNNPSLFLLRAPLRPLRLCGKSSYHPLTSPARAAMAAGHRSAGVLVPSNRGGGW